VNVEFRQRFEKDLVNILDPKLLARLQSAVDEARKAKSLGAVHNLDKLSGKPDIIEFGLVITASALN
jgi:hypothetical protein